MPTDDKFDYHTDVLAEDDDTDRLTARGTRPRLTLRSNADFLKVFQFLEVADGYDGNLVGVFEEDVAMLLYNVLCPVEFEDEGGTTLTLLQDAVHADKYTLAWHQLRNDHLG